MAKKLFGLSVMWILVLLAVLYFVFGVGREGFKNTNCSVRTNENGCKASKDGCTWTAQKCSIANKYDQYSCEFNGGTWTMGSCS